VTEKEKVCENELPEGSSFLAAIEKNFKVRIGWPECSEAGSLPP
jgi:hypothetical protein